MADVKISGLPAATSAVGTQEYEVNEAGTSKKVTGDQIITMVQNDADTLTPADIGITVQGYDVDTPTVVVSQAEAEAGTSTDNRTWTPQRVAQAIAALGASPVTTVNYSPVLQPLDYLDITGQETQPKDVTISTDGTELYTVGADGENVDQWSMTTAYDLSTATYTRSGMEVGPIPHIAHIRFSPDGTKAYGLLSNSLDTVSYWTLSTAWNISTATSGTDYDASTQVTGNIVGINFNSDGTKMYLVEDNGEMFQYSLSTAYVPSTATYDSVTYAAGAPLNNYYSASISSDGTAIHLFEDHTSGYLYTKVTLNTAYSLSSCKTSAAQPMSLYGNINKVSYDSTGKYMYIVDDLAPEAVRRYQCQSLLPA